jgi:cyclic pyranopterin phosphate synthase
VQALSKKKFALGGHDDMYAIAEGDNRPMILIGG